MKTRKPESMAMVSQTYALLAVVAPLTIYVLAVIYQYATSRKESANPLNRSIFDLGIADLGIFLVLLGLLGLVLPAGLIVFLLYTVFLIVIGTLVHFQAALATRSALVIIPGLMLCSIALAFYGLEFEVYQNFGNATVLIVGAVLTIVGMIHQWRVSPRKQPTAPKPP